jgi:hypothetical protein
MRRMGLWIAVARGVLSLLLATLVLAGCRKKAVPVPAPPSVPGGPQQVAPTPVRPSPS